MATANLSVGINTTKAKTDLQELKAWMTKGLTDMTLSINSTALQTSINTAMKGPSGGYRLHINAKALKDDVADALKGATSGGSIDSTQVKASLKEVKAAVVTGFAEAGAAGGKALAKEVTDSTSKVAAAAKASGVAAGKAAADGMEEGAKMAKLSHRAKLGAGSLSVSEKSEYTAEEVKAMAEANESEREQLRLQRLQNQERREAVRLEKELLAEKKKVAARLFAEGKNLAPDNLTAKGKAQYGAQYAVSKGSLESMLPNGAAGLLQATDGLEKGIKKVGQAHTEATGKTKAHTAAMHDAHSAARGLASGMGMMWLTWGNIAPLLAGASLSHGFIQAMKAGTEFAYQLTFVKALGGETAESVRGIGTAALELSKQGLFGPVELANGLRTLSQAGLSAAESMKALPVVLDLATVGEMNMKDAAITLVGVMTAFNLEKSELSKIGDTFAKAAAVSQTSVEQMTQAMKTASVVGEQYGASLGDTATALTVLARLNITGTAAGTSLRNMLKELYTPTEKAAKIMKDLGVSAQTAAGEMKPFPDVIFSMKKKLEEFNKASQVKILQGMFGERGAKEAIAMLSMTREEWDKLNKTISESSGFMRDVSAELEGTVKGSFKQAINTLQASLIEAYNSTEGAAGQLAGKLKETFGSAEFKESLTAIVNGMLSITNALVAMAPALAVAAGGWIALRAAMIGAAIWTSVSTALAGATLGIQTLGAVAAGTATTLTGASGILAAARLLPGALGAAGASILATTGVLGPLAIAIGVAGAAWYLFRDRTDDALNQSTAKVRTSTQEMISDLRKFQAEAGKLNAGTVRGRADAAFSATEGTWESLTKDKKEAAKRFGLSERDLSGDFNEYAVAAKATSKYNIFPVLEAIKQKSAEAAAQREAALGLLKLAKKTEEDDALIIKSSQPSAGTKDYTGGSSSGGRSSGVSDAAREYKSLADVEKLHFDQQKELIDQRVKYGNISQSAANVLLEVYQHQTDKSTASIRNQQAAELLSLASKEGVSAAERRSILARVEELKSVQQLDDAKRGHILTMREERAELQKQKNERDLNTDIRNFETSENLARVKEQLNFDMRKLSAEAAEATNKYLSVIDKGNDVLKKYAERVNTAKEALVELKGEFGSTQLSTEAQTEAIIAQEEELGSATEAYNRMSESIKAQAQASAENTFNIKEQENAVSRLKEATAASSAVMDAMLSARKHSGYYTDLEALRAEGNINKEKLSQLAELKAAYEAMGAAGAAAAAQVEAQMIELSAHLDPVADKIRGIFEDKFTTFFEDIATGAKTAKEAFKDLGKNLLSEFTKISAKEASQQLMRILGGGLEPGGSQGLFGILSKLLVPQDIGKDIVVKGQAVFGQLKGGSAMPDFKALTDSVTSSTTSIQLLEQSTETAQQGLVSLSSAYSTFSTGLTSEIGAMASEVSASTLLQVGATEASTIATEADTLITQLSASAKQMDVAATQASTSSKMESGGSGLLSSLFRGFSSSTTSSASSGFLDADSMWAAKGAAFDSNSVRAFAKGGIVNTPTNFRFADGGSFRTGLMGEAGPEAIMPLTRDGQGRLGVRYEGREAPQSRGTTNVATNNISVTVNSPKGDPAEIRRSGAAVARQVAGAVAGSGRYR